MPYIFTGEFQLAAQKHMERKEQQTSQREEPADSFDFTARDDGETQIALLLPAVQKVETAYEPVDDFADAGDGGGETGFTLVELLHDPGVHSQDHGGWTEISTMHQGINRAEEDFDFLGSSTFAADSML